MLCLLAKFCSVNCHDCSIRVIVPPTAYIFPEISTSSIISENFKINTMSAPQFTPLTNLSFDTFQNQIKVIVGAEKAEVFISIDLVTQHSEFFKKACSDQWESGRTKTVVLDHEEPEIFEVFLNWMYTGSIQSSVDFLKLQELDRRSENNSDNVFSARFGNKETTALFNSALEKQWMKLAKCFVLSHYLIAPDFHNLVTDMIVLNH
jgi:hypothetical protein